jgi:ABC-type transport system substrate-binding protein
MGQQRAAGPSSTPGAPSAPKTLTIATRKAPTDLHKELGQAEGNNLLFFLPHDYLVVEDDHDGWLPQLAAEQISIESGTWRLNPDNSMDTTWRLKSGVRWHDGAAFTADDLVFSLDVYKDPELPTSIGVPLTLMESANAPDPLTLVIHWAFSSRGAYNNPRVDALLDRLVTTVDPAQRVQLHRDLLVEQVGDVALMPLYWGVEAVPAARGVRGLDTFWGNVFNWDRE